jgi:hypothetical protein
MAISRPVLLALIGAVLAAATFLVASSARDKASGTAAVAPAADVSSSQAPAAKPAAANLTASETIEAAFAPPTVKSGRVQATVNASGHGNDFKLDASGSFQLGGPTDMPKLDVKLTTDAGGKDTDIGFVSTGDKGYVIQDGTAYALPAEVWSQAVEARASQQQGAQRQAQVTAAALGIDPAKWVRDVKDEGTEEVDGVQTRHVSATIAPTVAMRDLARIGGAPGLPAGAASAVKDATLDAWVGVDDRIVRRVTANLDVSGTKVAVDVTLSDVNEPQTIAAPADVKGQLPPGLLGGASPAFAQGLSLATGAPAKQLALPTNNNPQRLDRAVGGHRKVILFFHQQRGLDDQATADAVRAFDRRTKVLVLSDDVRNADRYGKLVEDLGVTQAPSIVIVDRRGKARLIEGYVDEQSLAQEVSDAR